MKPILVLTLLVSLCVGLPGCKSPSNSQSSHSGNREFHKKTDRQMNAVTGNYEAQPPYGPRSNKSEQ